MVTTKHGEFFIGIFCHGNALEPVLELNSEDCKQDVVWSICEDVIEGELLEFAHSLLENGHENM